jgi:hypothetical protein
MNGPNFQDLVNLVSVLFGAVSVGLVVTFGSIALVNVAMRGGRLLLRAVSGRRGSSSDSWDDGAHYDYDGKP